MIDRQTEQSSFIFILYLSLPISLPFPLPPFLPLSQVICGQCANVSEREEDFLDIPVALTGRAGLEAALKEMFCDIEILDGSNQYRCERCQCLVDAKRVSK